MKDSELNKILKSAEVPGRPGEFWEEFPRRVTQEIRQREALAGQDAPAGAGRAFLSSATDHPVEVETPLSVSAWQQLVSAFRLKPVLALGLVGICLASFFLAGHSPRLNSAVADRQFAGAEKYFREIEALFPNQLQAIVLDDQQGPQLLLADAPTVPSSAPLYVKICGPAGCKRFITFSGQQIRINGETCDVLVDSGGHVLLVGKNLVWSGADPGLKSGPYQIEARALTRTS